MYVKNVIDVSKLYIKKQEKNEKSKRIQIIAEGLKDKGLQPVFSS